MFKVIDYSLTYKITLSSRVEVSSPVEPESVLPRREVRELDINLLVDELCTQYQHTHNSY